VERREAVVIGVGGLGHMAVQILRALSPAKVIAVDTSDEKLALARDIGADETVESGEDAAEQIRELTGDRGAELVLDNVGADETLALAGGKLRFGFGALPFESQLTIPYWGTAVELGEVLDLARAGKIHAHVERFRLDRVEDAYARMRAGTLDGRAVICPND
jgi:alcohol dehydrogenase, propanol-preferring